MTRATALRFRSAILTLAAVVFPYSVEHVSAQTAKAVAAKAFPSVVLLLMEDARGQPLSLGSGFVIQGGYIATNLHVVRGASRGTAKLIGQPAKAEILGVVAVDPRMDIVLLQVKGLQAPPLPIGDSSRVAVGEEVFAIGNPQGLEGTMSQGIVSGIRKVKDAEVLQITAPISPGSSGGPVLDQQGKVIGIAVATFRGGQNLNFAIPSFYLANLVSQPKHLLSLSAGLSRKESKSATSELGGKAIEGVLGSNITCTPDYTHIRPNLWECSFSLLNKLRAPVRDVRYLVILYSKGGEPLDTKEGGFLGVIRPGLAVRPTYGRDYTFSIPHQVKQITSRIEIRVLNFAIDE